MDLPPDDDHRFPQRHRPAQGVRVESGKPTIVYVTVCTKDRERWLATAEVHDLLVGAWKGATAWLVGRYVVMPDHIHLFAAPGQPELPLENWIRYWKSQFSKAHKDPERAWQPLQWDRRLRSSDSYEEKWEYVRNNPVRHKLVERAEDWPYQGELNVLRW
jgi:REP element-mobilizing transposase RayT